jgi:hypothetical protein
VVDACLRIILAEQAELVGAGEPRRQAQSKYLGPPRMTFQPNDYGDDYTKRTCLWGEFNTPTSDAGPGDGWEQDAPPLAVARPGRATSVTPAGFARAFFEANA